MVEKSASPGAAAPAERSYEQARAALEDVVRRLEAGGVSLEESLSLWEQGEALAATCQERLDGARARLDARLSETADTAVDAPSGTPAP